MSYLLFFQPTLATHHRQPLPFPRSQPRYCRHRILLRSAPEERKMVAELELDSLNWNWNGRVLGLEVVEESKNGRAEVLLKGNGASNGSLVKYAGENGAATVTAAAVDEGQKEGRRRKRVEEIAKEDAWFKKTGSEPQLCFVICRCQLLLAAAGIDSKHILQFKELWKYGDLFLLLLLRLG